jgi:AraC family transcriptional regulator
MREVGLASTRSVPGFTITEFSQTPNRRLPWHEHLHASVCYVVSGSYAERTRTREEECAPRSMVLKPAAERHADVFGKSGGRCLLIEILPERLETIEPYAETSMKPGLARSARLAVLGTGLYHEFRMADTASALALEGGILEVLAVVSREIWDEKGKEPAWLRRARDLIHDRVDERLSLSTLAREVGIHPSHLARTFRRHYRRPIGEYLRSLRIERASRELADGTGSISAISLRAGFYDQSHFTRVFRRHTGVTPARFRALAS